jgi:hypothetical protein
LTPNKRFKFNYDHVNLSIFEIMLFYNHFPIFLHHWGTGKLDGEPNKSLRRNGPKARLSGHRCCQNCLAAFERPLHMPGRSADSCLHVPASPPLESSTYIIFGNWGSRWSGWGNGGQAGVTVCTLFIEKQGQMVLCIFCL